MHYIRTRLMWPLFFDNFVTQKEVRGEAASSKSLCFKKQIDWKQIASSQRLYVTLYNFIRLLFFFIFNFIFVTERFVIICLFTQHTYTLGGFFFISLCCTHKAHFLSTLQLEVASIWKRVARSQKSPISFYILYYLYYILHLFSIIYKKMICVIIELKDLFINCSSPLINKLI